MEAGAGVTRRAALVRFGGALAGGMMASACGALQAGNGAGASGTPVVDRSLAPPVPPSPSVPLAELLWRSQVGTFSLAVSGDTDELMAFDAVTGELLWKHPTIAHYPTAPSVAGDAVCVGYLNSVQAFSARTGQELWSYPVEGLVTELAVSGDTLYAAVEATGPAGGLYALRVPGSA